MAYYIPSALPYNRLPQLGESAAAPHRRVVVNLQREESVAEVARRQRAGRDPRLADFAGHTQAISRQLERLRQYPAILGYAAVYGEKSIARREGLREMILPGAFDGCDFDPCYACLDHERVQRGMVASVEDGDLILCADDVGLHFTILLKVEPLRSQLIAAVNAGRVLGTSFAWHRGDSEGVADSDNMAYRRIRKVLDVSLCIEGQPFYPATVGRVRVARYGD